MIVPYVYNPMLVMIKGERSIARKKLLNIMLGMANSKEFLFRIFKCSGNRMKIMIEDKLHPKAYCMYQH